MRPVSTTPHPTVRPVSMTPHPTGLGAPGQRSAFLCSGSVFGPIGCRLHEPPAHFFSPRIFSVPFCDWWPLRVYSLSASAVGARHGYTPVSSATSGMAGRTERASPRDHLFSRFCRNVFSSDGVFFSLSVLCLARKPALEAFRSLSRTFTHFRSLSRTFIRSPSGRFRRGASSAYLLEILKAGLVHVAHAS
eukprot:1195893-Prorocentrum_minimum.AAC.5